MTKEQIEQKASEIAKHIIETYDVINKDNLPNALWFAAINMADWLLDNLWISVEDELPPFDESVIVHYDIGNSNYGEMFSHRTEDVNVVKDNHDFCTYCDEMITHWMKIPKLNKK